MRCKSSSTINPTLCANLHYIQVFTFDMVDKEDLTFSEGPFIYISLCHVTIAYFHWLPSWGNMYNICKLHSLTCVCIVVYVTHMVIIDLILSIVYKYMNMDMKQDVLPTDEALGQVDTWSDFRSG